MPYLYFRRLVGVLFISCFVFSCGLISDQPDEPDVQVQTPSNPSLKESGLQCLTKGETGCAKENYCRIRGDAHAGLRCCLAGFLDEYFSENTRELGLMLGYTPVSFSELRDKSREELLKQKGLPFAELFLLSFEEAPTVKELMTQWGIALSSGGVSTQELAKRFRQFGMGMESAYSCLDMTLGVLKKDEVEKEIFGSKESFAVNRRDLYFLKFVFGSLGYLIQSVSQYEPGVEQFPSLPISDDFISDLNGFLKEDDDRFGDLEPEAAKSIAQKFALLHGSFLALKSFSDLKDQASSVDGYLNWRFSKEFQEEASQVLKSFHQSLTAREWVDFPDSDYQINLTNLSTPSGLPNGKNVDASTPVLVRDHSGELRANKDFFKAWARPVVRPKL